jgi:hypothetical protein
MPSGVLLGTAVFAAASGTATFADTAGIAVADTFYFPLGAALVALKFVLFEFIHAANRPAQWSAAMNLAG